MLVHQFADLFVLVLLAALAISVAMPFFEHDSPRASDFVDAYVIASILLANAVLGFVQEYRAENAIAELERLAVGRVEVRRPEGDVVLDSAQLVPGEVFRLEAGDRIPADARLLETQFLEVDESALTGESLPVAKSEDPVPADKDLADRSSMVHAGTLATRGHGLAVTTTTGLNTEVGRIAGLMVAAERAPTPLERQLARLGRLLGAVVLVLCVFVFFLGWFQDLPLLETALVGVSLAVSAVPEGLPAVVTVCFALGVRRMAAADALVRRLESLETLGSVTVIATDKTGTLTQNRMSVVDSWVLNPQDQPLLAEIGASCNHARDENKGDPTETALLAFANAHGATRIPIDEELVPFTSQRKYMATRHGRVSFFKGAPEQLSRALDDAQPELHARAIAFAERGLRVLAAGVDDGSGARVIGIWGLEDPPREGVSEALTAAASAGVRTIMVTGDHLGTARAIAEQVGIHGEAIEGRDLDQLTASELAESVGRVSIFARVSPENKVQICRALESSGEIVAMTGDGVNDAPALRSAHVGIAMGLRGTDVAREAASIVLANDHFATIVAAIAEGRRIHDNIRRFVLFLLRSNFDELLLIAVAMMVGLPLPYLPVHILWINLMTDGLPALALATEPAEADVMTRPPRPASEHLLSGEGARLAVASFLCFAAVFILFAAALARGVDLDTARSAALTLGISLELLLAFSARSRLPIWRVGWTSNRWLLGAVAVVGSAHLLLLYTPLSTFFHLVALSATWWAIVLPAAAAVFLVFELFKAWSGGPRESTTRA
jgi:Ca2+-transporting ATPase